MEIRDRLLRDFLSAQEGKPVRVITHNGHVISGTLLEWDDAALLLSVRGQDRLVLLSAVSTII